mmetsp:Transcript_58881/g.137577  ORF Transcript_58881/g.137577 Transcript_58881/m.137577 type:complete len:98 (-) Transcript_58881:560-853(-)
MVSLAQWPARSLQKRRHEARKLTPDALRIGTVLTEEMLILRVGVAGIAGEARAVGKWSVKPAAPLGVALPRKVALPISKLLLRSGLSAVFGVDKPEG